MRELGVYTRYSRLGASSRLRYCDYFDAWRDAGFDVRFHPLLGDAYLRRLYATGRKSPLHAVSGLLRRMAGMPFLPERLMIEYELLPGFGASVELAFLKKKRYVLNFDDNVWEKYPPGTPLAGKYDALVRNAAGVIAANDFLLEKLARHNENIIKIPTAVDLGRYDISTVKHSIFTLAWIGTPVTYAYLEAALPALRAMARAVDFELLVIARAELAARPLPGVRCRWIDWCEEAEVEELSRCHVGIMPLPDDPFARGKSAYKLIQYLAAGLPVIASPIGENRCVVLPGENGFLAETLEEWAEALCFLVQNDLSAGARASAERYSLKKYRRLSAEFLRRVLS